jgi:hypothetical protein
MLFTLLLVAAPASAQRYSERGDTVTLTDRTTDTVVTVVPVRQGPRRPGRLAAPATQLHLH